MRRWLPLLLSGSLALASTPALAQGIDLTWNDCATGPTASANKDFTCGGPLNQTYSLVLQFKTAEDIPEFVALTAYLDLAVATAENLRPFWHYEMGGCNRSPVSGIAVSDVITASCEEACYLDPWEQGAAGFEVIAAYQPDSPSPGRARMVLVCARSSPTPILAGRNYFGLDLRLNNRNRFVCPGCEEQAAIVFNEARLEGEGSPVVSLTSPDKWGNCVGINGGGASFCGIADPCPPICIRNHGNPCDPTPSRRGSWTLLKTLYR